MKLFRNTEIKVVAECQLLDFGIDLMSFQLDKRTNKFLDIHDRCT